MTVLTGLGVTKDGSANGTTSKALRLAIGGLLAKSGASPLDVRKGILWDTGAPVVTGTGAMTYDIRACSAVVMPSSTQGPIIVPNDAAINVATTPAPGSNSRIDVIWVRQHLVAADGGADSDVIGEWGVAQGTAGASPAAPSIPSGAVEIARATVPSGTTATSTLTISQTHLWTCADGAPIPVRSDSERTASLTPFDGMLVNHLADDRIYRHDGTEWRIPGDTGWVALTAVAPFTLDNAAVRKVGSQVTMRGAAYRLSGSSSSVTTAATIPAGYRPPVDQLFPCGQPAVTVGTRGFITATGNVQIAMESASAGGMSLIATWFTD